MPYISDSANLYRVETAQKAVILTMLGGEELRGNVFIHQSSYRPFELEDVSELLNAGSPFFPLELETGEVILVSKERVAEARRTGARTPSSLRGVLHHGAYAIFSSGRVRLARPTSKLRPTVRACSLSERAHTAVPYSIPSKRRALIKGR